MKKIIVSILIIGMLLCVFSSCSEKREVLPDMPSESVPLYPNFYFDSTEELFQWLKQEQNEERDDPEFPDHYKNFMKRFQANTNIIYAPVLDGAPLTFRNWGEGYSNVTLLVNELHQSPWIWYYYTVGNEQVIVKYACLTEEQVAKLDPTSASKSLRAIDPKAANTDMVYSGFECIEERELTVAGKTTLALYLQGKDDARVNYCFVYENALIKVMGKPSTLTPEFFSRLGFVLLTESPASTEP